MVRGRVCTTLTSENCVYSTMQQFLHKMCGNTAFFQSLRIFLIEISYISQGNRSRMLKKRGKLKWPSNQTSVQVFRRSHTSWSFRSDSSDETPYNIFSLHIYPTQLRLICSVDVLNFHHIYECSLAIIFTTCTR